MPTPWPSSSSATGQAVHNLLRVAMGIWVSAFLHDTQGTSWSRYLTATHVKSHDPAHAYLRAPQVPAGPNPVMVGHEHGLTQVQGNLLDVTSYGRQGGHRLANTTGSKA